MSRSHVNVEEDDWLPPVAMKPDSIDLEDWGHEHRLVLRWFNYCDVVRAIICACAFALVVMAFTMFAVHRFGLIHLAFVFLGAVLGTYESIAGFVNRTVITMNDSELEIAHGPLPWFGNMRLPAGAIEQVYATYKRFGQSALRPPMNLNVVFVNGSTRTIVRSIFRSEALFIEQLLEEWLDKAQRHARKQAN